MNIYIYSYKCMNIYSAVITPRQSFILCCTAMGSFHCKCSPSKTTPNAMPNVSHFVFRVLCPRVFFFLPRHLLHESILVITWVSFHMYRSLFVYGFTCSQGWRLLFVITIIIGFLFIITIKFLFIYRRCSFHIYKHVCTMVTCSLFPIIHIGSLFVYIGLFSCICLRWLDFELLPFLVIIVVTFPFLYV